MTAARQYILYCDHGGCQDWIRCAKYDPATRRDAGPTTLAEARKWAHRQGWRTSSDRHDYCPRHNWSPSARTP